MDTFDMFEIEKSLHRWSNQLSFAAGRNDWSTVNDGVRRVGLSCDFRKKMVAFFSEIVLEDNAIEMATKMSVMDEVVNQLSLEIEIKDFPKSTLEGEGKKLKIIHAKVGELIGQMYAEELKFRQDITLSVNKRIAPVKAYKI